MTGSRGVNDEGEAVLPHLLAPCAKFSAYGRAAAGSAADRTLGSDVRLIFAAI